MNEYQDLLRQAELEDAKACGRENPCACSRKIGNHSEEEAKECIERWFIHLPFVKTRLETIETGRKGRATL